MKCPCCNQSARLRPEVLADVLSLDNMQTKILVRVAQGKGQPVSNSQIIYAMYGIEDHSKNPYRTLKTSLCHLRKRLRGTGVAIEHVGYAMGYRLVETGKYRLNIKALHRRGR